VLFEWCLFVINKTYNGFDYLKISGFYKRSKAL